MAQGLDDMSEPNRPEVFNDLNDRLGRVENFMEDVRPKLYLLRLNQEAMLRLPANEILPQLILRTSARSFATWEGKKTQDYHKLMSLNNILQSLVATGHSGPALHHTIACAKNVILVIKTSWANVKAAETAQDLVELGLSVAPVPMKVYKQSNNHRFPYRFWQSVVVQDSSP